MLRTSISQTSFERTALMHSISFLSPEVRDSIRVYFEYMHQISLDEESPLTRQEVEIVLRHFFDDGAKVLIDKFNTRLSELRAQIA